jgi:hypothetical protein
MAEKERSFWVLDVGGYVGCVPLRLDACVSFGHREGWFEKRKGFCYQVATTWDPATHTVLVVGFVILGL